MSVNHQPPHVSPRRSNLDPVADRNWSAACPRTVREAFRRSSSEGREAWQKHLQASAGPRAIGKLLKGKGVPLTWSLTAQSRADGLEVLLSTLDRAARMRKNTEDDAILSAELRRWLASPARSSAWALECLAWCHALRGLAAAIDTDLWWRALVHLLEIAGEADAAAADADPLTGQLTAAELPLSLGYLFPELAVSARLLVAGREQLDRGMEELLDGEGLIHARHREVYRPLVAVWTRSRAIILELGDEAWKHEEQYGQMIHNLLRLVRPDGSQALEDPATGSDIRPLVKAARGLLAEKAADYVAHKTLARPRRPVRPSKKKVQPPAADHSEWAGWAVLRSSWSRRTRRVTVAYPDGEVLLELNLRDHLLFSGSWGLELRVGGVVQSRPQEWEEVCWISDKDVDYLEIEGRFGGGLRVQRQCMLAHKDKILILADAVLGTEPQQIEYTSFLPTARLSTFCEAPETREGWLHGKGDSLVVAPALPEWRSDARGGSLAETERGLELRQSVRGTSLYAPLFIDLDRRSSRRQVTWRQLSVAERRELLPSDAAVGYRIQVGNAQWLIYRSLIAPGIRTVLGQNLSNEFLAGRFHHSTGKVDTLVAVEPITA